MLLNVKCFFFFAFLFLRCCSSPLIVQHAQARSCSTLTTTLNGQSRGFTPLIHPSPTQQQTDEQAAAFVVGGPGGCSGLAGTARFQSWPEGLSPSSMTVPTCCGTACTSALRMSPVFRFHPRVTITFCRARRAEGRWV